MDQDQVSQLLTKVKEGKISPKKALDKLKDLPFKDLKFAKIDTHRELRKGTPEAIYCKGKTSQQVIEIIKKMRPANILATRASGGLIQKIKDRWPNARLYKDSHLVFIGDFPVETVGKVAIVTAGTADISVARISEVTVRSMGVGVETTFDVGVSGLHRIADTRESIEDADVAIVVAGMDGALPSVVAGLVSTPVVAVPTAVGYGANFNGLAPLLTMLNSCAPGVAVVNIGDGYNAGYFAACTVKKFRTRRTN